MEFDFDLIIVGSGPGGYVAAIRASQLGLKTAVIEKDKLGGVCLNIGCIPSKTLVNQAEIFSHIRDLEEMNVKVDPKGLNYKKIFEKSRESADKLSKGVEGLMKKNKITVIKGTATLTENANTVDVEGKPYTAKNILIATGSSPRQLPGFEFDEKQVLSSTGALYLQELPKSIVILGSGAIGMEFAYTLNAFGTKVTVVEMLPHLLPMEDRTTANVVEKEFKAKGVEFLYNTKALSLKKNASDVEVTVEIGGEQKVLKAEKIMIAAGRVPNTAGIGLEKLNIETDRGFVTVRDYYRTSVPNIYAIGDIVPTTPLAHVASKEGEIAVEHMAGHPTIPRLNPLAIPAATYCQPQIASFGYTEERAIREGVAFKKAMFPYSAIGKAVAMGRAEGLVKILYHPETHELLGVHLVGTGASETIHELIVAKNMELLPEDLATMIHIHPTISEAVMEVTRAIEGWAIHI